MRWDSLFEDFESQMAALQMRGLESEISGRAHVEIAAVGLTDRLRAATHDVMGLVLEGGLRLHGELRYVGRESLVLADGPRQWLVPHAAVTYVMDLGRRVEQSTRPGNLGLASGLRALARDRVHVNAHLSGSGSEGRVVTGVIDRVGRDHFDLTVSRGEVRREHDVRAVVTIPFGSLLALSSREVHA